MSLVKYKLSQKKIELLKHQWYADTRWRRQHCIQSLTFDQFVDQVHGVLDRQAQNRETYKPSTPFRRGYDETKNIPSLPMTGTAAAKPERMTYSGERTLLGIGMLHKSNLVPVFDVQSARDLSTMRRN